MPERMWRAVCDCFSGSPFMTSANCVKCGRPGEYDGWHMGMTEAMGAYELRMGLKAIGPHRQFAASLFEGRFEACPVCGGRGFLDADEGRTWQDCPRCRGACHLFKGARREFQKIRSRVLGQFPQAALKAFSPPVFIFDLEDEPNPVGNQKPDADAFPDLGQEAPIRCVFYTLVVRNEALDRKWKGGLHDYWRRYDALHNDNISVNCFMGPYWDAQVDALITNGLIARNEFALFDASDVIPMKDYEPFPLPAGWLGGYVHTGAVMVYMKQ